MLCKREIENRLYGRLYGGLLYFSQIPSVFLHHIHYTVIPFFLIFSVNDEKDDDIHHPPPHHHVHPHHHHPR